VDADGTCAVLHAAAGGNVACFQTLVRGVQRYGFRV